MVAMAVEICDPELLDRVCRGDKNAFEDVVDTYWGSLVEYVALLGADCDTAEDVTQQVFMRLWERRGYLKIDGSLRGLIYKIARNLYFDLCRRRSARRRAAMRASEEIPAYELPIDQPLRDEIREAIVIAVNSLPKRRREVFVLVRHHGLSHNEVSEALNLAPQTVANHLSLALANLRETLAAQVDGRRGAECRVQIAEFR